MKKLLIIGLIIFCIFRMIIMAAEILIGDDAADYGSSATANTLINKGVTATGTGTITSIEIWANTDMTGVEVATFYVVSGDNLSTRDNEAIAGTITAGSKVTKVVDLDVVTGDYIGIYYSGGRIELENTGTGVWLKAGDNIPADNVEFTPIADAKIALHGIGATVSFALVKFNNVTVTKWNELAITKWNNKNIP